MTIAIGTDHGGAREVIVDGATGFLTRDGDVDAIARALAALRDDPDLGRRLGAAGRARVEERFLLPRMLESYRAFYRRVARP